MEEIFKTVKDIIVDVADIPEEDIEMSSAVIDDLCLSSLEIMAIVGAIETKYKFKVSTDELNSLRTIEDVVNAISERIA